ncbi:dormancy-associated protein homolog 3 isoform X2 [Capsella rubella]|uniref:dormancy-associated protein homolog 3 isoform X2 n=1 Tax=Capsella rubella TaxID=81985 RepID=UPI000CD575AA|nr:dormancy-associated protein homolog 3 isoform X2 [Capsella rubella]
MKPLSTTNNKQQFLRKLEKDPKNFSFLSISTFLLMGLLDHLWDDTVAGPRPENGLGKLRKHHTFSFRPSSDQSEAGSARSYGEDSPEETVKVTRSIMIIKPPGYQSGSAPASPAGSTPPLSPFSPPLSPFTEQTQQERNPFGLGGGRRRMRSIRRQSEEEADQRLDQGALLLLTACDL